MWLPCGCCAWCGQSTVACGRQPPVMGCLGEHVLQIVVVGAAYMFEYDCSGVAFEMGM